MISRRGSVSRFVTLPVNDDPVARERDAQLETHLNFAGLAAARQRGPSGSCTRSPAHRLHAGLGGLNAGSISSRARRRAKCQAVVHAPGGCSRGRDVAVARRRFVSSAQLARAVDGEQDAIVRGARTAALGGHRRRGSRQKNERRFISRWAFPFPFRKRDGRRLLVRFLSTSASSPRTSARSASSFPDLPRAQFHRGLDVAALVPLVPTRHDHRIRVGGDGLLPHHPVGLAVVAVRNGTRRSARRLQNRRSRE